MKIETISLSGAAATGQAPRRFGRESLVAVLVASALFWLLCWYMDTALSTVAIWQRSDTFAHGFIVVPMSAWLVWRLRGPLAAIALRPSPLVLPLLALAGFTWLLAGLASVGVVQQFSLVFMIVLTVWAILGTEAVKVLAFPLFFLLFAVPFGEFLEPPLMEHTANFTVATLKLSGIPVYREGLYFTIPSGSWSVVEACSGLRYLIASVTLGFLYAYLTYRSFRRRALFVAAAFVVPVVANWLRAYMIVMIGHLSGMKYAVGVDHLLYGWVFFGIVMAILFWVGSYWREDTDPLPQQQVAPARRTERSERSMAAILAVTLAVAVLAAAWPLAAARIDDMGAYAAPQLEAPPAAAAWRLVEGGRISNWTPRYFNFQASVRETYTNGTSGTGLLVVYYRQQRPGAQLISSQNAIVSANDRSWKKVGESRRTVELTGGSIPAVQARLQGPSSDLVAWYWYWIDGQYVSSPHWAKFLQAKSKLLGRGDDAAVVIVYTLAQREGPQPEQKLRDFLRDMLPGITRSLENARRVQPAS